MGRVGNTFFFPFFFLVEGLSWEWTRRDCRHVRFLPISRCGCVNALRWRDTPDDDDDELDVEDENEDALMSSLSVWTSKDDDEDEEGHE